MNIYSASSNLKTDTNSKVKCLRCHENEVKGIRIPASDFKTVLRYQPIFILQPEMAPYEKDNADEQYDTKIKFRGEQDNPAFIADVKCEVEVSLGMEKASSADDETSTQQAHNDDKPKDIWAITWDNDEIYVKWSDLSTKEKVKSVCINTAKTLVAVGCLYIFICSISMLGDAFQILAGKAAGDIFSNESFLSNPITGLIIGILVTVLVQSSSTSTSIIITMVAAGIIDVHNAIPIIMGTNIGTSVTNTIVALTQSMDKVQFRRAFAGATVHDIFNLLSVLVLLTVEIISGYLEALTGAIIESFNIQSGSEAPDILKVITDPVVKGIVVVNKTVITLVAQKIPLAPEASMIKTCCEGNTYPVDAVINVTAYPIIESATTATTPSSIWVTDLVTQSVPYCVRKCKSPDDFLFANTGLSDPAAGAILLVVSLIILSTCLILMVKVLNSMLQGSVARVIKKVINTNFRYPFGWVTGYLAIIVGAGMTFVVQSSSVFTSSITPLVGLGVVSIKRMYPLTLGANIGTTTTSILAALASDGDRLEPALQLALVHLFFNITGILLWYPIPFMRLPIGGSKALGMIASEYRWFAVLYLIMVFFVIPLILLAFSFVSVYLSVAVVVCGVVIAGLITLVNVMQSRRPKWLPRWMRTWLFLPAWMRSLQPYDRFFTKYLLCCSCFKQALDVDDDNSDDVESRHSSAIEKDYVHQTKL